MMFKIETPQTSDRAVVRDAVLGDGLILNRTSGGGLILHAMWEGGPKELGCFDSIADAWMAVDDLDRAAA